MTINHAEFNTLITALGMTCATVQAFTGFYVGYIRKKTGLIKTNPVLFQSHRAFGSFATILYLLGLFAGIVGFVGALTVNKPPLELGSASFNIHTWGSFVVLFFFIWKTWDSYFNKPPLYGKRKWLGPALFLSWGFTWITSAVSFYSRTLPSNLQHPPPKFLLPFSFLGLQLALPFVLGSVIGIATLKKALKREKSSKKH